MSFYIRIFLSAIAFTFFSTNPIASTYKKQATTPLLSSYSGINTYNKSNNNIHNDFLVYNNKKDKANYLVPSQSTVNPFNKNNEWTTYNLFQALNSSQNVPISTLAIIGECLADKDEKNSILLAVYFKNSSFTTLYKGFNMDALFKKTISNFFGCKLTKKKYGPRKEDVYSIFPTLSFNLNDGKLKKSGWITKKAIKKGNEKLILYSSRINEEKHICIVSDDVPKKSVIEAMHFNYAGNYVTEGASTICCSFCNLICFPQFRLTCSSCNFLWSKDKQWRNSEHRKSGWICCTNECSNFCNCIGTPVRTLLCSCCNGIYKKKNDNDPTRVDILLSCFNCFSGTPKYLEETGTCCNGGCSRTQYVCGGCQVIGKASEDSSLGGYCNGACAPNTGVYGFGLCACKPNTHLYGCCFSTCPDFPICTCLNSSREEHAGFLCCCTWDPRDPGSSFWLCKGLKMLFCL